MQFSNEIDDCDVERSFAGMIPRIDKASSGTLQNRQWMCTAMNEEPSSLLSAGTGTSLRLTIEDLRQVRA